MPSYETLLRKRAEEYLEEIGELQNLRRDGFRIAWVPTALCDLDGEKIHPLYLPENLYKVLDREGKVLTGAEMLAFHAAAYEPLTDLDILEPMCFFEIRTYDDLRKASVGFHAGCDLEMLSTKDTIRYLSWVVYRKAASTRDLNMPRHMHDVMVRLEGIYRDWMTLKGYENALDRLAGIWNEFDAISEQLTS